MVVGATGGSRLGEHAVYPGTFDPITPGHIHIIERARHLFARVTVLVAVNADKQPAGTPSERATMLRGELPANWDNVSVTAWAWMAAVHRRFCAGSAPERSGSRQLCGVRCRDPLCSLP
jgi:pantetheine-phosphate adenylyltransferase